MNDLKDYTVSEAREIGGVHRDVGEVVALTEVQAKYYLPPYGNGLTEVDAKAPQSAKQRPAPVSDAVEG